MKTALISVTLPLLFFLMQCHGMRPVFAQGVEQNTKVVNKITANDLIAMENASRNANGLGSLKVDSNIMKCAQETADTMAYFSMGGHIGDVKTRISSCGYNNFYECWATENWWQGPPGTTLEAVKAGWGDAPHMIPAENPLYCHIGAGVAEAADGTIYFVLQAAYPANKAGCDYLKPEIAKVHGLEPVTSSSVGGSFFNAAELIYGVRTATPDPDGLIYHTVRQGQALWHIANAYGISVEDIARWNHIKADASLRLGEVLIIPSAGVTVAIPTAIPTILPTMNPDGKFIHTVREGETLWQIAELWQVDFSRLLAVNGLMEDTVISVGWRLSIPATPTATPLPSPTGTITTTILPTQTPPIVEASVQEAPPSETTGTHPVQKNSRFVLFMIGLGIIIVCLCFVIIRMRSGR